MENKSKYHKEEHEWNFLGITFPKSNELSIRCRGYFQLRRLYKTLKACGYDFNTNKDPSHIRRHGRKSLFARWCDGCGGICISKYRPNGDILELDCEMDDEITYEEFNDMLAGNS